MSFRVLLRLGKNIRTFITLASFLIVASTLFQFVNYKFNLDQPSYQQNFKELSFFDDNTILQLMNGPLDPDNPNLISYIKKKMLHSPSQIPYNLKFREKSDNSIKYNSYKRIVISYRILAPIIRHIFKDRSPGFFIEAGAMDGEFISNTLSLELENGWTGLLVEPDEELHKALLKKNRKSWSIHACLSTKPYPFRTHLLKVDKKGLTREYARGANALVGSKGIETRMQEHYTTYEEVQCLPLQSILKAINVTTVNFFSLDVEDVEMEVLRTIPFNEIYIESLVVEHRSEKHVLGTIDSIIDRSLITWFNKKGYSLYTITTDSPHNYFFIKNDSGLHQEAFAKRPSIWDPELIMQKFVLL